VGDRREMALREDSFASKYYFRVNNISCSDTLSKTMILSMGH